ncbi:MAG: hypothetical protein H7239_11745 [Flavobacterium sp.]|nr:hypothetical protein [Flavobacterium sp.]
MSKKIKLIWDFKGQVATKTAQHHEVHLKEFILLNKVESIKTGFEIINEFHAIAFMVVNEDKMLSVRDLLKPHRGEIYSKF